MKNIISTNSKMNKSDLENLSKNELIEMLLKLQAKQKKPKIIIVDDSKSAPIPTPRKSVKQMVEDYEDNIILPPPEFRDGYKPVPMPRTKQPVVKKPLPLPRTKIEQVSKALKGYTKSYEISIKNNKDPLVQLKTQERVLKLISKI